MSSKADSKPTETTKVKPTEEQPEVEEQEEFDEDEDYDSEEDEEVEAGAEGQGNAGPGLQYLYSKDVSFITSVQVMSTL